MFTDETEIRPPLPSVTSSASLATDLSWLLSVAARPSMQAKYPKLAEMFHGREDLAERIRNFWGCNEAAEEMCMTELQVLVHHGGATCETDPEAVWRAIEKAVATVPVDLDMPSESPEELAIYVSRFRRLKESPELVRAYIDLLKEVWAPVNDVWQQSLPVIEEAGRHVVAQYHQNGQSLDLLVLPGCDILRDRMPEIMSGIGQSMSLLFVPCLFFGSSMYLEFPGLVVLGTGVGQGDLVARARTESVARRLKAVADPTRLAILHSLATAPSTVGELAVLFRIAQPTVSMHVKVLRESGLVSSERIAGRLRLNADAVAVESLLDDLRHAVLQRAEGASTTGSERIPATVEDGTRSAVPVTA
jgi:DNA-binding transcriptional ArsR family regulator